MILDAVDVKILNFLIYVLSQKSELTSVFLIQINWSSRT